MSDKKKAPAESPGKKRKILADLHSGMVLLARFADPVAELTTGRSRRVVDSGHPDRLRVALGDAPTPSSQRWN